MEATKQGNWEPLQRYLTTLDTITFREYQETIGTMAASRNTLVILPTALGKTIIALKAAMLRFQRYPWGKVVFLAPTRPLVEQHARSFTTFLQCEGGGSAHFTPCQLNGKVPSARRRDAFAGANLVFATPQTLANDIASGACTLHDCILLVLDECHRTAQRYAYNAIAAEYMRQCSDPAILALTASPGRTRDQVEGLCERLHIEHVASRTMDDEDVAPYVHPIEVDVTRCPMPLVYDEIDIELRTLLVSRVEQLQGRGFLKEKPASMVNKMDVIQLGHVLWSIVSRELGADLLDGASDAAVDGTGEAVKKETHLETSSARTGYFFWLVRLQSQCMKLLHLLELVSTQSMHAGLAFIDRMRHGKGSTGAALLKETGVRRAEIWLRKAVERGDEHPKTRAVIELLDDLISKDARDDGTSVIIFAQYRDTVNHLVDVIETLNGGDTCEARRFRPARFVGQASRTRGDAGQSQQHQQAVLDAFRAGQYNVLVATRIAEEGLDIPSVGHIIFYEPVPSEIRYIQRRGRTGRHGKGFVTIFVADGTLDEIFLNVAFSRARAMNEIAGELSGKPLQQVHRVPLRPPLQGPDGEISSPDDPVTCSRPSRDARRQRSPVTRVDPDSPRKDYWNDDPTIPAPFHGPADDDGVTRFDALLAKLENAPDIGIPGGAPVPWRDGDSPRAVNWHDTLKRCTSRHSGDAGKASTRGDATRMKRTGLKKFGASGIPTREKLMTWIHDQVKELGRPGSETGTVELDYDELAQMASFEEIAKEEFTYDLGRGEKKGYWAVKTAAGGKKVIVVSTSDW